MFNNVNSAILSCRAWNLAHLEAITWDDGKVAVFPRREGRRIWCQARLWEQQSTSIPGKTRSGQPISLVCLLLVPSSRVKRSTSSIPARMPVAAGEAPYLFSTSYPSGRGRAAWYLSPINPHLQSRAAAPFGL